MVNCPRCDRDVDSLQIITPDVVTRELIDSLDDSEGGLAEKGEMKVCEECMDTLKRE